MLNSGKLNMSLMVANTIQIDLEYYKDKTYVCARK